MSQYNYQTQDGISTNRTGENRIQYTSDNLFAGTWRLDQDNLARFDPYITGYGYIIWTKLPKFFDAPTAERFRHFTEKNFKTFSGITPITLAAEEMTHGFTGNAMAVASNITKENTSFSITHYEMASSPGRELYSYWIYGIRDPETGLATYHGRQNEMIYSAMNHTAELMYISTNAFGAAGGAKAIEFACYYTNVFPTQVPMDHLNYQSGEHSVQEFTQEFRGNYHQGKHITSAAVELLKRYVITRPYSEYGHRDDILGKSRTAGFMDTAG